MPGPYVTPVHGDAELPRSVDVVVIGGGIVGASTALELAQQGVSVALCEKGGIGHEQSSRNWGWVRLSMRDPREVPLMAHSLKLWSDLNRRTGRETGFQRAGIVLTSASQRQYERHERWINSHRDVAGGSRMLSTAEVKAKFPGWSHDIVGAFYAPDDCRGEPQLATPAIAEAARERGASILTECAVRGFQTAAGRISGVVTERGEIACQAVVLAGGAWSSLFLRNSGLDLPQLGVMNTVLRTKPLAGGPEEATWASGFAFRKRLDGGYTIADGLQNIVDIVPDSFRYGPRFLTAYKHEWRALRMRLGGRFFDQWRMAKRWALDEASPFEYNRVLDPIPSRAMADRALSQLKAAMPFFDRAEVAQYWTGMIDVTPDAVPVIDAIDSIPGFHVATGFSGHGFGIGPGAGRLMADIVTGGAPIVDPSAFRFKRFSDGSRMTVIAGV